MIEYEPQPIKLSRPDRAGRNSHRWKDDVGYHNLHLWIRRNYKSPKTCQSCGLEKKLDLANISNTINPETYTRDIKNWQWLCRSCHMTKDGRMAKITAIKRTNLSDEQVLEILNLKGKMLQSDIMKKYGIGQSQVSSIWTGRRFKRITGIVRQPNTIYKRGKNVMGKHTWQEIYDEAYPLDEILKETGL